MFLTIALVLCALERLCAIFFYSTASLYPSLSIQTRCVSPFFFISRAEVVSSSSRDANTRTHIHFFSLLSACYVTILVRFITALISVSTALLAFLPRVLSLRAWHWLTPAVRFHFALLSIFLCPFLLFKLIFRLFYFSRRPPTSLSVYIKLSLLLLACLLLRPEIKSWLRLSRRVLLIFSHLFLLFHNPSSII